MLSSSDTIPRAGCGVMRFMAAFPLQEIRPLTSASAEDADHSSTSAIVAQNPL